VNVVEPLRTTAVFHLAELTGPANSLRPRLAHLGAAGSLEVVVPGPGATADLYAPFACVTAISYGPVVVPRSPAGSLRAAAGQVRAVAAFTRHFRRRRPHLVVVSSVLLPAALVAARVARTPVLVYAGEVLEKGFVSSGVRRLGARSVLGITSGLADAVVCASNTVAGQFDPEKVRVRTMHPGISEAFGDGDGQRFRRHHGLPDDDPVIAVVGNLSEGRGQDLAIEAAALLRQEVPNARLVLAGDPHPRPADLAFRARLLALARARGLADDVLFSGFVDPVADLYAASSVVVNPARSNEGFGRVAFEALAAGRPVVATRVGAIPEVLAHERDALLVPPESPEAIAAAVARLLREPDLAARLAETGRERVRAELSEERGVEAFTALVSEVLGRPVP
jgi:glycosyltransferase involved in cell wall biosynthesis